MRQLDFSGFKCDENHTPLREGNPHPGPRCVRLPSLRKSALLALGKRLSGRVVAAGCRWCGPACGIPAASTHGLGGARRSSGATRAARGGCGGALRCLAAALFSFVPVDVPPRTHSLRSAQLEGDGVTQYGRPPPASGTKR